MKLIKTIKNLIFHHRMKKAIREANELHRLTGYRYLVIMWKGNLKIIQKREIKQWIAARKLKKGITIRDVEKKAIYITA